MNKSIEAIKLGKRFGAIEPVKQVSFAIDHGEFVTLLGPSGSGKSTLLSLVAGLDSATAGQVLLNGQDLSALSEDELALLRRDQVGFVFQAFHLIPTLSALENVALPLYPLAILQAEKRQRAMALLKRFDLGNRCDHLPSHLSGGERQRVAIARALINQPRILFCDEPTGNLDSATGKEILDLLLDLNRHDNLTIFMVTHDTNIAKLSDRSLYMKDGEVV